MADNVPLSAPVGMGDVVAADEIPASSGIKYQRVKLIHGGDGVNVGDVSLLNGFPVQQATGATFAVTGSFFQATQPVSGTVSVSNFPAGFLAAQSGSWTVSVTGSVEVTGTFWQATQPVSNAGTFAVQAVLGVETTKVIGTVNVSAGQTVGVTGTFWQTTQPVSIASLPALTASSAVIGHVVVDSGAVNATLSAETVKVIGTINVASGQTVGLVAGVAEIGNIKNSGTFVVQATLAAETTKVIGTVNLSAGQTVGVTGTFWQATQPVSIVSLPALTAGSAVIGHVIVDSGAITSITNPVGVTGTFFQATQPVSGTFFQTTQPVSLASLPALTAGSAVIGHVIVDSGAVNATLSAETVKVIGTVNIAAGQTIGISAGVAEIGNVKNSGTFAVQATLSAETTKVIGTVNLSASQTVGLVAGSAVIGKVSVDQTTPGTTNLVAAGQNGTWTVQPGNTPNTTPWLANRLDPAASTGSITAADAVSTSSTNSIGQAVITGAPTANSSVSVTVTGHSGVIVQLSGTFNGTVVAERSADGGTSFVSFSLEELSVGATVSSLVLADNKVYVLRGNVGELTTVRIRCTSFTSGTLSIRLQPGYGVSHVVANQGPANSNLYPWPTTDTPQTTGGLSTYSFLSTAAVQNPQVKGTPGQVYSIEFFNTGATPVFVRLYNQTGAPASTDAANIIWRGIVPGNTAGAGFVKTWEKGLACSTGIGFRCTNLVADNDTTVLAANAVIGNVCYK